MASLAGYWRSFPKRFLMAASFSDGEYSSAFVTCPDTDVAKKIARFDLHSILSSDVFEGHS